MTNSSTHPTPRSVLTIGSFDGVHAGHQALIQQARSIADAHTSASSNGSKPVRVVAEVFDPSPLSVLRPNDAPPSISTFEQRREWLLEAGADEVFRLEPTRALLSLSAAAFVARKAAKLRPIAWVEGPDFRFGYGREGDLTLLALFGREHGFEAQAIEPVTVSLDDHSVVPARSTTARWLLSNGRVRDAAHVLTRPYQMFGTVIRGDRRGRTIGYPTANLDSPCLAPRDGVYAGLARLPDGRSLAAAISIGNKPTFGPQPKSTVEAFILDPGASGKAWQPLPGLAEYGWSLRLDFLAFIRDQIPFSGLPPLLEQIERDCERVAAMVSAYRAASSRAPAHARKAQEVGV